MLISRLRLFAFNLLTPVADSENSVPWPVRMWRAWKSRRCPAEIRFDHVRDRVLYERLADRRDREPVASRLELQPSEVDQHGSAGAQRRHEVLPVCRYQDVVVGEHGPAVPVEDARAQSQRDRYLAGDTRLQGA